MLMKELSTLARIQPRFFEPMYAQAVRELPDGGLWTYEAKLDGYRCLAANRGGRILLWSRRGNGFTVRFPEIARACEKLPSDTMIDGEVVAIEANGRVSIAHDYRHLLRRRDVVARRKLKIAVKVPPDFDVAGAERCAKTAAHAQCIRFSTAR
jgi:bifunctional non-homologous end joining protein LigD